MWPDLFFYANCCHVCKCFGEGTKLKRCGGCKMISYCSKEHQRTHWPRHKDLCKAICSALENETVSRLLTGTQARDSTDWNRRKSNLMLIVNSKIGRRLDPGEQQMFLFPRACAVCHEQNFQLLNDCENCPNTSLCKDHKDDPVHKDVCSSFKLAFDLDVLKLMSNRESTKFTMPEVEAFVDFPNNMKVLVDSYSNTVYGLPLKIYRIYQSSYLTRPLTLFHALRKLKHFPEHDSMCLHIIGANTEEVGSLAAWEVILHLISTLKLLKVVLIGPDLTENEVTLNLCKACYVKDKKWHFELRSMLYEQYARSSFFSEPDLIIGYNLGIHMCEDIESEADTWTPSLKVLVERRSLFIITAYTLQEAQWDQRRMKKVLGDSIDCLLYEKNPYSSLYPHRNCEGEGVFYQNQYIMIFQTTRG